MPVTAVFGMQWGDEGKGRVVDLLAASSDVVVRFQGGANAGHTVIVGEERYVLHLLPSGVIQPTTRNVIGHGVVVDPWVLVEEIDGLAARGIQLDGRLLISDRAHVVLPHHKRMDAALEALRGSDAIGTTSRGIGPTYADKARRAGLRVAELMDAERCARFLEENVRVWNAILQQSGQAPIETEAAVRDTLAIAERLRPYVADTTAVLCDAWRAGATILLEGAQGFALDIDQGSYPFVTSSHTTPGGAFVGTGLPPKALDRVIGIIKAYSTRVGAGPFPTQAAEAPAEHMGRIGREFGATTGRPRGCGWFDGVVARRAVQVSGTDYVALMKLDVLSGLEALQVCVAYELDGERVEVPPASAAAWSRCKPIYETFAGWSEDISGARTFDALPEAAQRYVLALEALMGVPIELVSVGAERACFLTRGDGIVNAYRAPALP